MLKVAIRQQPEFFERLSTHWNNVTTGKLVLLSPSGELLSQPNGVSKQFWKEIIQHIPRDHAQVIQYNERSLIAISLTQDSHVFGYLLAIDGPLQQASLLDWVADTITSRVTDMVAMEALTDELIGAWEQLELIYRVTEKLTLTSDLQVVLQSVLREIQKVTQTQDSFILLERADERICVTGTGDDRDMFCSEGFLDRLAEVNRLKLCNRREECREIWPQLPEYVCSMLVTPLQLFDDSRAAIGLINKPGHRFTAGDAKLLIALAQHIVIIIKNHMTHQKLLTKERLSRELEIAAEIQESFLPTDLPQMGGLAMAVSSIPASEVGGDFFDLITVDDHRLTVVIGDVSGKGIPAAMLTSVTRTMLRVEAMRGEPPHRIIQQANSVLYHDLSRADAFVTVLVATIDTHEGLLTYASAGHTPAIIWRKDNKAVELLKATSLPIGVFHNPESTSRTVQVLAGDTVVFYTDGITESQSPGRELFGLDRLINLVGAKASGSPEQLQDYIQSEVANFRGNAAWKDDATLLVLKTVPTGDESCPPNASTTVNTVNFLYPADMEYLSDISKQIANTCRELSGLPIGPRGDDFICLLELAISEICTNIVKHAYAGLEGSIRGQVTLLNEGVQLDFYDQGEGFDPESVPELEANPYDLREGGYGLHIVRQIMDVVSYESNPAEGNHWHLIKYLPTK